MHSEEKARWRIVLDCPDRRGVVAEASATLSSFGATILDAQQHLDPDSGHFFMRYEIARDARAQDVSWSEEQLRLGLQKLANDRGWAVRLSQAQRRPQVALLATKASHCLVDILQRWRSKELPCDIACVIANHKEMEEYAGWYGVPFHHVDFQSQTKEQAFEEVDDLLNEHNIDCTVLARFMQIIPQWMAEKREGQIINIHHSFLPGFVGARPYDQAHARGVKMIGATCHYVTADLDQGPIIEQEVIRVSHMDSPQDLRRKGKMCEREALGRGLRLHLEDRVIVHGAKTIVFH